MNNGRSKQAEIISEIVDKKISLKKLAFIWASLQGLYPTKWLAAMGEFSDEDGKLPIQARVWQRELAGITDEQIANAIDYLANHYDPFIPDLGRFKELCRMTKNTLKPPCVLKVASRIAVLHSCKNMTTAQVYGHPLIKAVVNHPDLAEIDWKEYSFRHTTEQIAKRIEQVYSDILRSGWSEFNDNDFIDVIQPKQLNAPKIEFKSQILAGLVNAVGCVSQKKQIQEDFKPMSVEEIEKRKAEMLARAGLTDADIDAARIKFAQAQTRTPCYTENSPVAGAT